MDDKGFAFTPLTFLLLVPVMILAISYNGIINEVNTISAIAVGGDVTITIANNIAIAANAVVNKSFTEENIMIGGVPAKKIKEIDISVIIKHLRKKDL